MLPVPGKMNSPDEIEQQLTSAPWKPVIYKLAHRRGSLRFINWPIAEESRRFNNWPNLLLWFSYS
eukprot:scaffold3795_cov110-Skeletonema_marinoi.AAC.1